MNSLRNTKAIDREDHENGRSYFEVGASTMPNSADCTEKLEQDDEPWIQKEEIFKVQDCSHKFRSNFEANKHSY